MSLPPPHAHSVHGKTWSMLRRPLDPITQDAVRLLTGDHAVFAEFTGVVLDLEEGKRIAHAPRRSQGGDPGQTTDC